MRIYVLWEWGCSDNGKQAVSALRDHFVLLPHLLETQMTNLNFFNLRSSNSFRLYSFLIESEYFLACSHSNISSFFFHDVVGFSSNLILC